jgi:hypothetical protein
MMMHFWKYIVTRRRIVFFLLVHGRPFVRIPYVRDVWPGGDDVSSANTFSTMGYYGVLKQLLPRFCKPQGSLILLDHRRGVTWNFA